MKKIADLSADDLARSIGDMDFSGVVSVAPLGTGASLDLAFGFADRANRIPNNTETRFAMASGCKAFTAVAIGLLIQEGRIALDTLLSDCVRSRQFHFGSKVTIGQLLNHTSGVPDYCSEELGVDYAAIWRKWPCYTMRRPADFLPLFEQDPLKTQPGSGFLYSNSGFVLLALVVEELTGRRFVDFVTERIFRPCGMTRSGYFDTDALPENTAYGYIPDDGGWRTNIFAVPIIGGGDGGAFTTLADMREFWTSLLTGRLLSPELVDRFLSPSVQVDESNDAQHYGYGIYLRKEPETWIAAVIGGDPGASMESQVWLSGGIMTTVLSNASDGALAVSQMLDDMINERAA